MDHSLVESVSASLVREYLSRRGLKMTLQMMDEEMPREEDSISNRNQLKKVLHLEKLMEKNKESDRPLKAMLEVMTKSFGEKGYKKTGSLKTGRTGEMTERSNSGEEERARSSTPSHSTTSLYPSTPSHSTTPSFTSLYPASKFREVNDWEKEEVGSSNSGNMEAVEAELWQRQVIPDFTERERCSVPGNSDLVIEDEIESETLLGEGRAGILETEPENDYTRLEKVSEVPPSQPKSRLRGTAGPIASNTEERRCRSARIKSGVRPSSGRPKATAAPTLPTHDIPTEVPDSTPQTSPRLDAKLAPQMSPASGRSSSSLPGSLYSTAPQENDEITDVARLGNSSPDLDCQDDSSPTDSAIDMTEPESNDKPSTAQRYQRDDTLIQYGVSKSCTVSEKTAKPVNFLDAVNNTKPKTTKVGDLENGDEDDVDVDVAQLDLRPKKPLMNSALITDSKPIDIQTAVELKTLCFGTPSKSFNEEWSKQGFTFSTIPKLTYGIVQKKGGPCGVLACVQAAMIQQLLFSMKKDPPRQNRLEVPPVERSEALALGLADILWRAGDKERAVVTIPSARSIFNGSGRYRPDHLTETLVLNHFKSYDDLVTFLKDHIDEFEGDGQPAVVLTVYSAILSRTVKKVREDMDDPEGKLVGVYNYCSQDLVNLLLIGEAVSNTFNDFILLDSCKQKGCSRRSDIGFLSLFEHYKSCKVGTYLKTPKFPIWVVCSESHFSVLFCLRKDLMSDWRVERRFDLFYYDGLANQDEEIRLTVVTSNRSYRSPLSDDDMVPPLELCIGTKWSDAEIDWNGTEPLL